MPPTPDSSILIAGAGRLAQALGRLLADRGLPISAVAARDAGRACQAAAFIGPATKGVTFNHLTAEFDRVLVAVADKAIPTVARLLADAGMRQGIALHTSGAYSAAALEPLRSQGVACGSLHPLQTIATPEQGLTALLDCAWAIDGDLEAAVWAGQIARLLGGFTINIAPEKRALYHAAAVMASNYVVTLVDAAVILMEAAGADANAALRAIRPLISTSIDNAIKTGPTGALTGPVQRGDLETVECHLKALHEAPPQVAELYRAAGCHAVEIAVRRGLAPECAVRIRQLLKQGA